MTDKVEQVWVSHGEPPAQFGWEVPGMLPGHLAQVRRMERLEQLEVEREQAERQARAEDRLERWMWQRAQEMSFRGEPFDLARPETLMRSPEQLADEVFAAQDAEAARTERKALIEAGLLHLLDVRPGEVTPAPAAVAESSASRASVVQRVRSAFDRWRRGDTGEIRRNAAPSSGDLADSDLIVRYVPDPGRIL